MAGKTLARLIQPRLYWKAQGNSSSLGKRQSMRLKQWLPESLFIPLQIWRTNRLVLWSVLLASLLVNLLSLAFPIALLQTYNRVIPYHAYYTLTLLTIGVCIALLLEASLRIARAVVSAWADAKFEH